MFRLSPLQGNGMRKWNLLDISQPAPEFLCLDWVSSEVAGGGLVQEQKEHKVPVFLGRQGDSIASSHPQRTPSPSALRETPSSSEKRTG